MLQRTAEQACPTYHFQAFIHSGEQQMAQIYTKNYMKYFSKR